MREDSILLLIAVLAVVFSLTAGVFTYLSFANLASGISGYVASGEINVTVETIANLNFTTAEVFWGSGKVDDSAAAASLTTMNAPANKNVTGGNWTLQTAGGLRIRNIGNVNLTLNISVTKTAATFIGGTNPAYQWNITALEANSCLNTTGHVGATTPSIGGPKMNLSEWHDTTTAVWIACEVFQFVESSDEIRIDINMTIPSDSLSGALNDTLTASFAAS